MLDGYRPLVAGHVPIEFAVVREEVDGAVRLVRDGVDVRAGDGVVRVADLQIQLAGVVRDVERDRAVVHGHADDLGAEVVVCAATEVRDRDVPVDAVAILVAEVVRDGFGDAERTLGRERGRHGEVVDDLDRGRGRDVRSIRGIRRGRRIRRRKARGHFGESRGRQRDGRDRGDGDQEAFEAHMVATMLHEPCKYEKNRPASDAEAVL